MLIFLIFGGVLGSGRHIGGILGHVGSILVEYEPERDHMDLVRTIFHDFGLKFWAGMPAWPLRKAPIGLLLSQLG